MARNLRKAPKVGRTIKTAQFCEIKRDVGCIPAGVYRLAECTDGCVYSFRLGDVNFTVITESESLVVRLPGASGGDRATTKEQFLTRYFELFAVESAKHRSGRRGTETPEAFTMAFLPPSAERYKLPEAADGVH